MKFLKSKVFIFCLIAAIILTLVPTLIAAFGGTDLLRATMGTVAKPFTWCASGVANAFNGFVNVFKDYDRLQEENESLREQLKEYEEKEYNEALLKEQNAWLKDYINLHDSNPEFALKDAKVISRESSNYETLLTLNKGSVNGIKRNMPVLSSDGLIGYVSETGLDWCRVSLIIEDNSRVGVYSERSGASGLLEGTPQLRIDGLCKMSYIQSGKNLQLEDRIYTSGGKDSIYPTGLLVGSISSIDIDESTGEPMATITPAVDFNNLDLISNVIIVCGYESSASEVEGQ